MSSDSAPTKKPSVKDLVGELLATRYRIEAKLGEGAMGAVYRARHVKVGRAFAVKVLHPHLLEDQKIAMRFDREAELAGRLHHPNVIGVVDVGETPEGLRYMVMDYAQGSDLARLLSEAPMPPGRIIPLVRQMLEGLHHAHEAGLIHRDFKPENVLVERDDHGREIPRIVDFGISILREGGSGSDGTGRLTTNGLVLGTPHYMAPEQAVADPIDHRIDLFAMGIVVYEMLCGKLPFDGAGAEVARANLLLDPPPISKRVPFLEVDPLLEAFSRQLMAKNREHRPPTARAARELLDLIERDRSAAVTTLGIPATASTREPALTQPVSPSARAHALSSETSGRQAPERPSQPPQAQHSQLPHQTEQSMPPAGMAGAAPPHRHASVPGVPVDAPPYVASHSAPHRASSARLPMPQMTEMAEPLEWGGKPPSKRRWLIGGAAGLAAAGAIAAIAITASGGDTRAAKQPEPTKIAMTVTPIQGTGPVSDRGPAEPLPRPPTDTGSGANTGSGASTGSAGSAAAPAITDAVPTKRDPETPAIKPDAGSGKPPIKTGPVGAGSAGTKPNPGTKISTATGPDKSGSAKPPQAPPLTTEDSNQRLLAEYQQVNTEISALEKALGAGTLQDLWQLYRHVGYYAAIQDTAKRQILVKNLNTIRTEIAKRKKR